MRIRRILSLAICLVMICLSLVGCEEPIGAYRDKYDWKPEKIANLDYDLYIIKGEGPNGEITEANAEITVEAYISNYLSEKFNSRVSIHYLTAAEYEAEAKKAVSDAMTDGQEYLEDVENARVSAGKILLVTSEEMMNEFVASNKLTNIYDFVYNSQYDKLFGTIKTQIPEDLMEAAMTAESQLYALPNNNIVGEYKYLVFNREATQILNYVDTENSDLRAMKTIEDCEDLVNYWYDSTSKTLYYESEDGSFYVYNSDGYANATAVAKPSEAEKIVFEDFGAYEKQKEYMENGYVCNISETPNCTSEEAFESAFAIIAEKEVYYWNDANNNDAKDDGETELIADKNEVAKRAMQIVNAINSDTYLRNLLQYGVKGVNYELGVDAEGNEYVSEHITKDQNAYFMPLKYTGNIFYAYFNSDTDDNMWTKDMYENGLKHNKKVNYYKDIYLKQ